MPKKSLNWSLQEQKLLKQLKEQQTVNNKKNWKIIAQILNSKFQVNKTPKQCRQRYINHLKFGKDVKLALDWTQEQLNLLLKLYLNYGSSWATISSYFQNKSENSIKNKFNNCLKNCAKNIQQSMAASKDPRRKKITNQLISIMLNLSNQIRKLANSLNLTINEDSMIFTFQKNIVKLCLGCEPLEKQYICDLIVLIRSINSKLRCFGLFKVSNRKDWKISQRNLFTICQFDKVVVQIFSLKQVKQLTEVQDKIRVSSCDSSLDQGQYISKSNNMIESQSYKQINQAIPIQKQMRQIFVTSQFGNFFSDEYLFDL